MFANLSRADVGAMIKTLGLLAAGFVFASPASAGYAVTWDLGAAGLNGVSPAPFTADAFGATEVSHIQFTDAYGHWQEHGYAQITGFSENGQAVSTPGLNSDYTLYVGFSDTGQQGINGSGGIASATETLYLAKGAAVFGIDPTTHDATIDLGGNPWVKLADSTLIWGTSGATAAGDFYAEILSTFTPSLPSVFQGLLASPRLFGNFFHGVSQPGGIQPEFDAHYNVIGVVLHGGADTLSFVPEPASLLLLLGGLPRLLWFRRRG